MKRAVNWRWGDLCTSPDGFNQNVLHAWLQQIFAHLVCAKTLFIGKEIEAQKFDDFPQIKGNEAAGIESRSLKSETGYPPCKCGGLVSSAPKTGLLSLSLSLWKQQKKLLKYLSSKSVCWFVIYLKPLSTDDSLFNILAGTDFSGTDPWGKE